jgi:hypothetical protein
LPCSDRDPLRLEANSSLDALVEQWLGSVLFVRDYVQLDFGDERFTAYVWPTAAVGNIVLEFGEPGYRDALCTFIGQRVTAAKESPERGLVIRFASGEIVSKDVASSFVRISDAGMSGR